MWYSLSILSLASSLSRDRQLRVWLLLAHTGNLASEQPVPQLEIQLEFHASALHCGGEHV